MAAVFDRIPEWDDRGLLPPSSDATLSVNRRSPYVVSLTDLVLRFGNTVERRNILTGFLDFRVALHQAGLVQGFQWVNGSLVENIMQREGREPRDIDVVTFFHLPEGFTQEMFVRSAPHLFDASAHNLRFKVDAYFVTLDRDRYDMRNLSRQIAYWNNLWSHTRQGQWKGYLEIDLSDDDASAKGTLSRAANEEATQ